MGGGADRIFTVEAVNGRPLVRLGGDLAMTLVIFAASIWKSNTSAYDAFWSVIPSYFSVWLWFEFDGANWSWMQWGTMVVLNLWSWRLTHNWARGWPGWHHEDWRYVDFRNQQGPIAFQFTNFFVSISFHRDCVARASDSLTWPRPLGSTSAS